MINKKVALVIGAEIALGEAITKAFAPRGFAVCMTRRNGEKITGLARGLRESGYESYGFGIDQWEEAEVQSLINKIERDIGVLELVVINIGANIPVETLSASCRNFQNILELARFSGALVGKEVARCMSKRNKGTIIFTSTTVGIQEEAMYTASKNVLRSLAQSITKDVGAKSLHIAHAVIDGAVDTEWMQEHHPDYTELKAAGELVAPEYLAGCYVALHEQLPSCWALELDIRPRRN